MGGVLWRSHPRRPITGGTNPTRTAHSQEPAAGLHWTNLTLIIITQRLVRLRHHQGSLPTAYLGYVQGVATVPIFHPVKIGPALHHTH